MELAVKLISTPVGFALRFIVCFTVLFGAFEASRGSAFERFVVEDLILGPTTALIDTVTPDEHAVLTGRTITSPASNLHITRGCEGIEMFLLLIAAVLAFPATIKRRTQGMLVGATLAYALSVTRLMALHYVLCYSPDAWEALHGLVLPLGPIILMAAFFLRWSAAPARRSIRTSNAHAT